MSPAPQRIDCVLLRHAESEDVAAGLVSGQRDVPLTTVGREEARAVVWRLAALGVTTVVSSDLARARETAGIIAEQLGLPTPRLDHRLGERHWGEWQGQPRTGSAALEDHEAPPGGETLQALRERVLAAVADVPARALVVSHAGPIREILRAAGREPASLGPCGWLDLLPEGASRPEVPVVAEVLDPGEFSGVVVYVHDAEDLHRVQPDSLVLLCGCPKVVAVEAVDRAAASVNLMRSLTAHLTHGRISTRPYAVALEWPDGFPREGERVRLAVHAPGDREGREPLPDVPPLEGDERAEVGGKAAGLLQLQAAGARVPPFHTISIGELERWRASHSVRAEAEAWTSRLGIPPGSLWAVRSSADTEDAEGDPLSGSFESVLCCSPAEVPAAVEQVAASAAGPEVRQRLQAGRLRVAPRMAVVVQRMVTPVRMAGTVFLPAPPDPGTYLLEARWGSTGEDLMGGLDHADVRARYDRDGRQIALDVARLEAEDRLVAERIADGVAAGALDLYLRTGRGDMEFAVDAEGEVWWLQARTLNEPVEVVDRRGFRPAAVAYYKGLAFRVAEANRTEPAYFRCFDLGDGKFGYSLGIRHRDRLFHERVREKPEHLAEVTAFGWDVERRMAEFAEGLEGRNPAEVLDLLTLHGAVQLPFSIPMNTARMDRYQSTASDGHPARPLLEELAGSVSRSLGQTSSPTEIIDLLRQPRRTLSVIEALSALEALQRAARDCNEAMVFRAVVPDLRDVPDLSSAGICGLMDTVLREYRGSSAHWAVRLPARIESLHQHMRGRQESRARLLEQARACLDAELFRRLLFWADYLEMKAETNETHCIYRGRCFVWFARIGFDPDKVVSTHRTP
jgi:broad specificity phosphatase PhoE